MRLTHTTVREIIMETLRGRWTLITAQNKSRDDVKIDRRFSPSRLQVECGIETEHLKYYCFLREILIMRVRILCATALGNHVVLQLCYYCNKSRFMIMTQEEITDTHASRTRGVTFMHIQLGHWGFRSTRSLFFPLFWRIPRRQVRLCEKM